MSGSMTRRWGAASLAGLTWLTLTACGGGGSGGDGGGSSGSAPTSVAAPVPGMLNGANAVSELQSAYGVAAELLDNSLTVTEITLSLKATAIDGAARPSRTSLVRRALDHVERWLPASADALHARQRASTTISTGCTGGGRLESTFNDRDDSGAMSTGDALTVRFFDCVEDIDRLNGAMTLDGIVLTDDETSPMVVAMRVQVAGLSAVRGTVSTRVDGGFETSFQYWPDTGMASIRIEGASLDETTRDRRLALRDFRLDISENGQAQTFVHAATGRMVDLESGRSVTMSTPMPLSGGLGRHPASGTLLLQASDGSQVQMRAQSSQVLVDVDEDGDRTFEASQVYPWSTIVSDEI